MELTYNLNVSDWYTNNPENNPKEYWPLDYPPLSGYYSYIWGYLSNILIPDSVKLKSSWGYESKNHKFLMRFSVIVSDLIFFHLPIFLLLKKLILNKLNSGDYNKKILRFFILSFIILCTPTLGIIDHGHFQYNCVMHGLFIFSVYFLYDKKFILSIILFSLCINFKQMGLYYALPFPFYVVKVLLEEIKNKKSKIISILYFTLSIVKYGFYTILAMALIWGPWIKENKHLDVINRIFPLWRGIFEDKVATFWCTLNIVYKISKINQSMLFKLSMLLTIAPSLVACICILIHRKPSKKITNLAFFIVSMSFFFFSFHVHEKTILVPYLAFLLNFFTMKKILPSFTTISLFSLYPLLKREGQHIPYFIFLVAFYIIFKYLSCKNIYHKILSEENNKIKVKISETNLSGKIYTLFSNLLSLVDIMNVLFIISYHLAEICIPAPKNYPYLYPMINAAYSFLNFALYYILAQVKLFSLIGNVGKAQE
jgi:alpha-1,3-glucosyltransferase